MSWIIQPSTKRQHPMANTGSAYLLKALKLNPELSAEQAEIEAQRGKGGRNPSGRLGESLLSLERLGWMIESSSKGYTLIK